MGAQGKSQLFLIQLKMSYQQSTNESGDLDLLCFNQGEIDFFNKHPDLKYPEAEHNEEFRRDVLFSEKFIDTHLSEAGVQQCHDVKHDPTLSRAKAVLVSPFNRALQTAKIVFGDKGVPIIVHPLLAESFRYSCDLSSPIKSKMAQFPEFDFTLVEGLGDHWYIQSNLGPKNRDFLKKLMVKVENQSRGEQQRCICSYVNTRELYESNEQLRERMRKMTRELARYRQRFQKLGVVAHQWSLRYLMSKRFDHNSYPLEISQVPNARPLWVSLAKLIR